jgi:hypothetical protein
VTAAVNRVTGVSGTFQIVVTVHDDRPPDTLRLGTRSHTGADVVIFTLVGIRNVHATFALYTRIICTDVVIIAVNFTDAGYTSTVAARVPDRTFIIVITRFYVEFVKTTFTGDT